MVLKGKWLFGSVPTISREDGRFTLTCCLLSSVMTYKCVASFVTSNSGQTTCVWCRLSVIRWGFLCVFPTPQGKTSRQNKSSSKYMFIHHVYSKSENMQPCVSVHVFPIHTWNINMSNFQSIDGVTCMCELCELVRLEAACWIAICLKDRVSKTL